MKTNTIFPALLFTTLAFLGCRHDAPTPATLILGFGGSSSSAKSFAPEGIEVTSITIEGAGPGGATVTASSTDYSPVELELCPGTWVITAKGVNAKSIEVASGTLELDVGPSERLTRDILLSPIVGEGSVALSWTLSGSLTGQLSVEGSLTNPGGKVLPIKSSFSAADGGSGASPLSFEGLSSGSWTLELRLLQNGASVCGLADGVLVAAGMETKLLVVFKPPVATLSLGFVLPDYASLALQVEPTIRRVSRGTSLVYRAPESGSYSWHADGGAFAESGPELHYLPNGNESVQRIDCVLAGSSLPRSGSAEARFFDNQSLGPLIWGEVVNKADGSAAAQNAMRALGDCRDLSWSADGTYVAAAGRSSNGLSMFEAPMPGAFFARSFLGGAAEPGIVSPSILRFLPGGSILALSESEGAVYAISLGVNASTGTMALSGTLAQPCLAGAKDIALAPDASCAYVAASGADAVALIALRQGREPVSASEAAVKGTVDLPAFSKPACLALSSDGSLLAVGTTGDDAIYFFARNGSTNALSFRSRLDKAAFPATAPLSDPCSLAFSLDGRSLFVLSYYGKALIRLDRDAGSGLFAPSASARSGANGINGFASPKRLALSPDGRLLAVIGSGADDGLSLFDVGQAARLDNIGNILPPAGKAMPKKPSALAFSPDGTVLAVAADGSISLFKVNSY